MEIIQNKYLKFIDFSELPIWDVKSFFIVQGIFKKDVPLVLFGEFLSKYETTKINIEDENEYSILGVRTYGKGVFINRIVKGNTLKMRKYQLADKDTLFWCKVDTKNGGFGVVKDEQIGGLGSTNMFFAKIDTLKINKEYLQMLFQSTKIHSYMDQYVTGTTNRKYIKPDQLLNEIKIPLPSISEQNRIVENYKKNFEKAEKAEKRVGELEKNIESYLMEELGIEIEKKEKRKKGLQFVEFKDLDIWNVWNRQVLVKSKKYDFIKIGKSIQSLENTISKVQKNEYLENGNIPIVSQENILISGYTNKNIKTINGNDLPLVAFGDHSKTVKYIDFEFVCGADGVRLMKPIRDFNIKYYYYYIESVVNFINPTESYTRHWKYLSEINIPLPPFKIQEKIVKHIGEMKDEIKELKEKVVELRDGAKREFEGEIFNI